MVHSKRGKRNCHPVLMRKFLAKFPGARRPGKDTVKKIWRKQMNFCTVNNVNSKSSPGDSHSGRHRTVRTPPIQQAVKAVMDRDAPKKRDDATVSPVSSARRNILGVSKSSWSRITGDLKYHPYKVVRRQELKP